MDNTRISHDEKPIEIHPIIREMRQVHRDYGLMIMRMGSGADGAGNFYTCQERSFDFYSISHCHDGKGRLWLPPNYESEILPGQCVIIPPNQINRYGGTELPYWEDCLSFYGPVADQLFKTGIIGCGIYEFGSARRILHIGELIADPAKDAQLEANFELQRLLFDIWRLNKSSQKVDDPIVLLQKEMRENLKRWWTVIEMAEFCCLSDDQFRRRFVKNTGMRPKEYLDHMKMHRATELLNNNSWNLSDIAEQLGYRDQFHFSRRFKAILGMSPRKYRLQTQ